MSYIDQSTRPSPAGMAAVIGVHAAIGAILVAGLTVTGTIPAIITSTEATNIPIEPPPPTPPEAIDPQPAPKDTTVIHAPKPPRDLTVRDTYIETTPIIVPTVPTVPQLVPNDRETTAQRIIAAARKIDGVSKVSP